MASGQRKLFCFSVFRGMLGQRRAERNGWRGFVYVLEVPLIDYPQGRALMSHFPHA